MRNFATFIYLLFVAFSAHANRPLLSARTPARSHITNLATFRAWFAAESNAVYSRTATDTWPDNDHRRVIREATTHQSLNAAHIDYTIFAMMRLPEVGGNTLETVQLFGRSRPRPPTGTYQQLRLSLYIQPGNSNNILATWYGNPDGVPYGQLIAPLHAPWDSNHWYFVAFRFEFATENGDVWINGTNLVNGTSGDLIGDPNDSPGDLGTVEHLVMVGWDAKCIISHMGISRGYRFSDAELTALYAGGLGLRYEDIPAVTSAKLSGFWEFFRAPTNSVWPDRTTNAIPLYSMTQYFEGETNSTSSHGDGICPVTVRTNELVYYVACQGLTNKLMQTNFQQRPVWTNEFLDFRFPAQATCPPITDTTNLSIYAVISGGVSTNDFQIIFGTTNLSELQVGLGFGRPIVSSDGDPFGNSTPILTNTPTIIEWGWTAAGDWVRINNGAKFTGVTPLAHGGLCKVGNATYPFNGLLGDLIIVSNPSSAWREAEQRLAIVRYLQAKHRL